MKIVRQFRPDLRAWFLGLLLGCGTSSGISAVSNPVSTVEPVTWRGATIVGYEPAAGVPYVEAGWQGALRKYGPGREPVGWRVDLFPGRCLAPASHLPVSAAGPRSWTNSASRPHGPAERPSSSRSLSTSSAITSDTSRPGTRGDPTAFPENHFITVRGSRRDLLLIGSGPSGLGDGQKTA